MSQIHWKIQLDDAQAEGQYLVDLTLHLSGPIAGIFNRVRDGPIPLEVVSRVITPFVAQYRKTIQAEVAKDKPGIKFLTWLPGAAEKSGKELKIHIGGDYLVP